MNRYLVSAALLLWSLWLSSEYLAFGGASYVRQHDTAEVNTPYYTALPLLARRNQLGFRDPLAGTGVDALANLKGDMPLVEALFRFAPHWSNSGVLLFAQTFLASLGTYALLRLRMGVSRPSALIASAWFGFLPWSSLPYSGFPTWYGWYVPAFPIVVHALGSEAEKEISAPGMDRRRLSARRAAVAVTTGAVLALGTPTASGILVLPAIAAWLWLFRTRGSRRTLALVFAICATAFVIVKLPAIVALISTVPDSHRAVRNALMLGGDDAQDLWPGRIGEMRAIALAHVVLIAVSLAGWLAGGFRERALNTAMAVTVALLAITCVAPLIQPVLGVFGDAFSTYQFERINRFLPFAAAVTTALALDRLRSAWTSSTTPFGRMSLRAVRIGALTGVTCSLVVASAWMNAGREAARTAGSRADVFFGQEALATIAAEQQGANLFRVATFADRNALAHGRHAAFAWAYGLETADLYVTTYSMRYHQFWSHVIMRARDRRPDIRRYFDTWGNMAYLFNPAARLFDPLPPATDLSLEPVPFDLDLLSLANVRYILSAVPLRDERLTLRPDLRGVLVYENRDVLPRAFVAHEWRQYRDGAAVLSAMSEASAAVLGRTAFIDDNAAARLTIRPPASVAVAAGSTVAFDRNTADRVDLTVTAAAAGILVISNAYSPFWTATIDGVAAEVVPVDHTFQGIGLGAGTHRVLLAYRPPHSAGGAAQPFLIAAALGAMGLAGTIAGLKV